MRAHLFPVGFVRDGSNLRISYDLIFFGTATEIEGGSDQATVTVTRTPTQGVKQFEEELIDAVLTIAGDRDYQIHQSKIDFPRLS